MNISDFQRKQLVRFDYYGNRVTGAINEIFADEGEIEVFGDFGAMVINAEDNPVLVEGQPPVEELPEPEYVDDSVMMVISKQ